MLSIGEFSRASGLTVKTLRFYHEKGLLEPAAVDPESGYRYYDQRNLDTAFVIVALRDLEFSLDQISTILRDCDDDADVLAALERQRHLLAEKSRHYVNLVHGIDLVIHREREARESATMRSSTFEIEERQIEPPLVAGIRMKGRYSDCGQGFARLSKQIARHICGKPLCLYYDGEYRDEDADFEPCFPIRKQVSAAGVDVRTLPGVRCVTLIHRGLYDMLGRSYARVLEYVKQKGHNIQLPTREVYLKGPGMIFKGNPKKYVTELQLPIQT